MKNKSKNPHKTLLFSGFFVVLFEEVPAVAAETGDSQAAESPENVAGSVRIFGAGQHDCDQANEAEECRDKLFHNVGVLKGLSGEL